MKHGSVMPQDRFASPSLTSHAKRAGVGKALSHSRLTPSDDAYVPTPSDTPPPPATATTDHPVLVRLQQLIFSLDGITERPTRSAREETDSASRALQQIVREVNEMRAKDVPGLNRLLQTEKLKPLKAGARLPLPR